MSRSSKRTGDLALAVYAGGIFITIVAMFMAVLISSPRPIIVVVSEPQAAAPAGQGGAAAAPAVAGAGAQATPQEAAPAAPAAPSIQVARVEAVPSMEDPFDPVWEKAARLNVPLLPQNLARPLLTRSTVKAADVQALSDGKRMAWRVSWEAPEPSYNVDADRFCDAVAIQFSLAPGTPFLMGGPGMPVHILHWKALWQKDVDEHYQQVEDVHANYQPDFYWFAAGAFPSPFAASLDNPQARQFMPAISAGNPMADPSRTTPIQELVAEGFGTSTVMRETNSRANGAWKDGRWAVVFDRPLDSSDPLAAAITSGKADAIALAVWDGAAKNVGGQKHYSNWIPVKPGP